MEAKESTELGDCPPSAKLVFKVLEYDGPLTQKQIVEESMLSARTVRYALERLEEIGLVDEDIYFADARQSLYRLEEPVAADGGLDGSTTEDACCAE
ncbi:winged helix-turn-helix domain-containing protein [Halovivax cerinus]|uniref:Winged helix-turn-helix domain-containing protein n=1 Tax=Halovivax cerinus TaxID=1487865 RepID=A0ABD5NJY6_9EURY|nr:winged helix-turn-helix domain-containing protein [Halovivax cerinus]